MFIHILPPHQDLSGSDHIFLSSDSSLNYALSVHAIRCVLETVKLAVGQFELDCGHDDLCNARSVPISTTS